MKVTWGTTVASSALVCALVLGGCGSDSQETPVSEVSNSSAAPSSVAPEVNTPGAMVGNTQRTWPDPDGLIDDSAHANPGTWSVDPYFQRPVWTPINHDGDLPAESSLVEGGFEQCGHGEIELTGRTTQQYVNARYLVVNDQVGPTQMIRGVPAGFAHSPQGAIVMALNALSYGLPGAGDGIGEEIDAAWWTTYEGAQKDREFRGLNKPEYDHSKWRPMTSMAPSFYRVVECSENVVVVEVGHDFTKAGGETASMTIPLYWRDGDWIPDLTGQAGVTLSNPVPFNPADPAPLKKVNYS